MNHSIWITPWDLVGREPTELIDFLHDLGLDACNLALSYHGGRMLLPMNRCHTIYEQHPGAVYFPADLSRYRPPLHPAVCREAGLVVEFLEQCRRDVFPVRAWTVLCHNDYLAQIAPDCSIRNAFGERYPYALCPSHPAVREYATTLLPGIAGLDLEAVGFLGYEHASLHDKAGIALPADAVRLLSICLCPHCADAMGPAAEEIAAKARGGVRTFCQGGTMAPVPHAECVLAARRSAQIAMLRSIRKACGDAGLNLRLALDPWFFGGKSTLAWEDLAGLVDAATVTFFGQQPDLTRGALSRVPARRPVPLAAGFVFHGPDCLSADDVRARYRMLCACDPEEVVFYSFSMAAPCHFEWLRRALQGDA